MASELIQIGLTAVIPTSFILLTTAGYAVKDWQARRPGGIYLPVSDNIDDTHTPEEDGRIHRKGKSGRIPVVDWIIALLCTVQAVGLASTAYLEFTDIISAVVAGIEVFSWLIAAYNAIIIARNSTYPPAKYHVAFWFYALSFFSELYTLHRLHSIKAAPHSLLYIQVFLGITTVVLLLDLYQRYRMDSFGEDIVEGDGRPPWREANASLLSKTFFFWLNPLIYLGESRPLEEKDLWELLETDSSASMVGKYRKIKLANPKRSLFWNLAATIKDILVLEFTWASICAVLSLAGPIFLNKIVGWVADPNRSMTTGIALLVGMFSTAMLKAISAGQMYFLGRRSSLRVRSVVVEEVYSKSLRRAAGTKPGTATTENEKKDNDKEDEEKEDGDASVGKVVTLMSVDAERLREFVSYSHRLTIETPITLTLVMSALFFTIGWSAIAGLAVIVLSGPFCGLLGKRIGKVQEKVMSATDKRVNVANEVLQGIRIIKYFAWEPQFIDRVTEARRSEMSKLLRQDYAFLGFNAATATTSLLISFVTFVVYTVVAGESLDPQTAFTAIALLNQVASMMQWLPFQIMELTQVKVSYDRIVKFLREQELEKYTAEGSADSNSETASDAPVIGFVGASYVYFGGEDEVVAVEKDGRTENVVLTIEDSAAKPEDANVVEKTPDFILKDLNVEFPEGKLSVICGPTGGGKTSVLLALLGELKRLSGRHYLPDSRYAVPDPVTGLYNGVAYVSQTSFLINASIRDNILFGSPYDAERYQKVVESCALIRDLQTLPGGDLTEIGEKGVNVSGGQKARISLARAAYSRASIILLDDVLAAVDAPTAKTLAIECIGGFLKDRTRLVVSHNLGILLPLADFVVCMKGGMILAQGTPTELVANETAEGIFGMELNETSDKEEQENEEEDKQKVSAAAKLGEGTTLIDEEERATGSVEASVYWAYIQASGGAFFLVIFILSFLLVNSAQLGLDWWLKRWTDVATVRGAGSFGVGSLWVSGLGSPDSIKQHPVFVFDIPTTPQVPIPIPPSPVHSVYYYISIYAALGAMVVVSKLSQMTYLILTSLRAAKQLHALLLNRIMGAPLRFFEVTPLGRILNRFSKDIKAIDQEIVWVTEAFVAEIFRAIYIFALIGFVNPAFLIAVIPVAYVYMYIARMYLATSRELKRLDSITRSPLYSQFSETLAGVTTIRAYGAEERLLGQQRDKVDANHRAYFTLWIANRWLCLRTDTIGAVITLATGTAVVMGDVSAGWAGLALTYALALSDSLLWTIRMHAEMEMNMNSVERVLEYANVEQEPPAIVEDYRPPFDWPAQGDVQVQNLSITYSADLPPVLKNLNFFVKGGEKVGIVGRTGAGKSTLSLAFFRILPYAGGTIYVDGVDIQRLGVRDVRSRFTIIPQDPVLFSGTLKSNLDPFGELSDEVLWEALGRVHVLDSLIGADANVQDATSDGTFSGSESDATVQPQPISISAILSSPVTENGNNFSQGQRQLLCLARALLRQTRLIFLDEATASIDAATDARIQKTMRECFATATVLCIAHRLRTVVDYDKILVLDKGEVVEYGTPLELIDKDGGYFRKMVEETGEMAELIDIAKRAEEGRRGALLD